MRWRTNGGKNIRELKPKPQRPRASQGASRSDRTGRSGQIRACLRVNPMTGQFSINLGGVSQSSSEEGDQKGLLDGHLLLFLAPTARGSTLTHFGLMASQHRHPGMFQWDSDEPGHTCRSLKIRTWDKIGQEEIQVRETAATGIKA